jgi:hypothetical protein
MSIQLPEPDPRLSVTDLVGAARESYSLAAAQLRAIGFERPLM